MSIQPTTTLSPEETIRAGWPQELPQPVDIRFNGDADRPAVTVSMPNGATVITTRFHDHQDSDADPDIGDEASGDWEAYVTLLGPWLLITKAIRAGLEAHQTANTRDRRGPTMSGGNQRDNLALDIWLADSLRASAPNGAPSQQDYAIADRLLAKGYTMDDSTAAPSGVPATEEYDFGDPDPVSVPGTFVRSLQAPVPTEEIITAHIPTINSSSFNSPSSGGARTCRCGARIEVLHSEMDDDDSDIQPYLDRKLAAHITEALAAAGQEGTR